MATKEEKKAAEQKAFAALWQTRNRGESVPIALEQQGVNVIDPDEESIRLAMLDVECDGVELIISVEAR